MAALDDLNNAILALQAEDAAVIDAVINLEQQVADLTAAIAAAGQVDPAIEAAADAVNAEVQKLKDALTPPAPPVA